MMLNRTEDGPALSTHIVKNDWTVCLDHLLSNRSLVWSTRSKDWEAVSVMNGGSNNFVAFGVEAFDIRRGSADKFCRAFGDAPQDFAGIRTKRQSPEQVSECFFVAAGFVNVPSRHSANSG